MTTKNDSCSPFPLTPGENGRPEATNGNQPTNFLRPVPSFTSSTTAPSPCAEHRNHRESGSEEEDDEVAAAFLKISNENSVGLSNPSPSSSSSVSPGLRQGSEKMNGSDGKVRRRAPDMQMGNPRLHHPSSDLEVLLIQEAKKKCYGKWYIPAGHVEPGETIEHAVKREMLEETGFDCSVDHLISTEIRGSGWYRMGFACSIIGGKLKTEPDRESLCAEWQSVEEVKKRGGSLQLRCKDFLQMLDEAVRYHQWSKEEGNRRNAKETEGNSRGNSLRLECDTESIRRPLLNTNEQQPGLFIEFVIVKMGDEKNKTIECLVHGSIQEERQLLKEHADGFPTVEFGFEFFFAMVVSKCYRHILQDGHQAIDLPSAVIGMWCLPVPLETLRQGLRLRILCRHKRAINKAPICVPNRYHWIGLEDEEVLASLYLLPDQFRPVLLML